MKIIKCNAKWCVNNKAGLCTAEAIELRYEAGDNFVCNTAISKAEKEEKDGK